MPKIKEELTEEDESRRQRRRERNKVAATKCRNKKKAKTINLMKVVTRPNNLSLAQYYRVAHLPLGTQ